MLWLNDKGVDIRCVRMKPYRHEGQVLIDAQQIIPLVEALEYMVRLREKRQEERAQRKGSTMDAFWAELEPQYHETARNLVAWLEKHFSRVWPGRGGCVPVVERDGNKHHLFRLRKDGHLEIYFDWLSRKPPLANRELRLQLLNRLNEIEGVHLPVERLEKRPRIQLDVLSKPEAMAKFQETMAWWLDRIDEHYAKHPMTQ